MVVTCLSWTRMRIIDRVAQYAFFVRDVLYGNFSGSFDLHPVSEENQVILPVPDNM